MVQHKKLNCNFMFIVYMENFNDLQYFTQFGHMAKLSASEFVLQ
jgi:hypothetical protein